MLLRISLTTFLTLTLASSVAQAQCTGFTTNVADFAPVPTVDLLPEQGFGGPLPIVRGGMEYTGATLVVGTGCPGAFGTLAMCDFSSLTTGVPSTGETVLRWGVDYWADVTINPFQLEVELASGAIDNFTATSNGGFVGYCALAGDPIVRVAMVGHDGVATALYHGEDGVVAIESTSWSNMKTLYSSGH